MVVDAFTKQFMNNVLQNGIGKQIQIVEDGQWLKGKIIYWRAKFGLGRIQLTCETEDSQFFFVQTDDLLTGKAQIIWHS